MTGEWIRIAARALAISWAGFWAWLGLASGLDERLSPVGVLMHTMVPGGIFLASALLAWRWQVAGGVLLLLEGLIVAVGYPITKGGHFPPSTIIFVLATMALPPLLAGMLLLLGDRRAPA